MPYPELPRISDNFAVREVKSYTYNYDSTSGPRQIITNESYPQLRHSIKVAQRVGVLCTGTIERGGVLQSLRLCSATMG